MIRARIAGTGSATPEMILNNADLEAIVDTSDDWIIKRTGIRERRIALKGRNETTLNLATSASLKALEMAKIGADALDMIVVGTVSQDMHFPSVACFVQDALNAKKAAAFDVSAGCTGFLYALSVASNAIATGTCRSALVIGVERLSAMTNWEDRTTCVLFGDGAGAVVLTSSQDDGILASALGADGTCWELLYSPNGSPNVPEILKDTYRKPFFIKMDGNRLFKKAIISMADISSEVLEKSGVSPSDIRLVVPHQANFRIIQALAERLSIPMEKVYVNIHKYGNTSSASIPIALDEAAREGLLGPGDIVLLTAFGAGLTWGASVIRWSF
nr:ketoacyl-ACP synthase III [Desulfobacterales bacterium]